MYVAAIHTILDPATAFPRGERLIRGEDAPEGVRALQFYPARDGSTVTCLWEAGSVAAVQDYVDTVLGDASRNDLFEIDAEKAFSERPLGMAGAAHV